MSFDLESAIVAGLAATFVMTLLYVWALAAGWLHLDFALLLGEVVMPRRPQTVVVGLLMHVTAGAAFAILYALLFAIVGLSPTPIALLVGAGFGVFHFLLAMPLIHLAGNLGSRNRLPSEANPGEWAINYGPQEAALRLVGHMVYGTVMAGIYGALKVDPTYRTAALAVACVAILGLITLYVTLFHTGSLEIHRDHAEAPTARFPSTEDVLAAREGLRRRLAAGEISYAEYQQERRRYATDP